MASKKVIRLIRKRLGNPGEEGEYDAPLDILAGTYEQVFELLEKLENDPDATDSELEKVDDIITSLDELTEEVIERVEEEG